MANTGRSELQWMRKIRGQEPSEDKAPDERYYREWLETKPAEFREQFQAHEREEMRQRTVRLRLQAKPPPVEAAKKIEGPSVDAGTQRALELIRTLLERHGCQSSDSTTPHL